MIGSYLTDSITLKQYTFDNIGRIIDTDTTTLKAFIEKGTKKVTDINGQEAVSTARVLIKVNSSINHKDKINFDSIDWTIVAIETPRDFSERFMTVHLK